MNASALLLHALKGTCALNCLAALHLAGPLPVTQRAVMDLTGFDDEAVRKGLNTLRVLGLATAAGDKRRTAWQLAPAAHSLPLPLQPFLPSPDFPESALLKEEEELSTHEANTINTTIDSSSVSEAPNPQKPESDAEAPPRTEKQKPSPAIENQNPSPATAGPGKNARSPDDHHLRGPYLRPARTTPATNVEGVSPVGLRASRTANSERVLRGQLYAAFEAANIYLQFRRSLADAILAEDDCEAPPAGGLAWLRQTLGWICYAQRRLPHVKRGAVVYISLRDRLPCDPAYLPPLEMPFEAALAWAARGGEDELEQAVDEADQIPAVLGGTPPAGDETPAALARPADDLWQAVIARLARELAPAVIDSQLRPARLVSLEADCCRIAAATPQSRDWMAARLAPVLARALRELTGRAVVVEVVADGFSAGRAAESP